MEKIPIECEECDTVVAKRSASRRLYYECSEGMSQTGMSKKYPGDLASYCKEHRIH